MKTFMQWMEDGLRYKGSTAWSPHLPNPYAGSSGGGRTGDPDEGARDRAQLVYNSVMKLDDRALPFLHQALMSNPRWQELASSTGVAAVA
jgi:hypothetical protein